MDYWQGVASRVNVVSVILIVVGAAACFGARKLAPLIFKETENKVLPMKLAGLLLAVVGALITLI